MNTRKIILRHEHFEYFIIFLNIGIAISIKYVPTRCEVKTGTEIFLVFSWSN